MNRKRMMNTNKKMSTAMTRTLLAVSTVAACLACGEDGVDDGNEEEVITSVILTFTPQAGGAAISATFDDPDGDGGDAPTVDPVDLPAGDYTLAVAFENRLETPAEDITVEVSDEADEHQVFLFGTAVNGPASDVAGAPLTHAYSDTDSNGFPIGLSNSITAATGTGTLTLVLRHLPPVNDVAVKTADLAGEVSSGGIASIAGESDVQVDFVATVP